VLGLEVSRSTLVNWVAQAATFLAPIHAAIGAAVRRRFAPAHRQHPGHFCRLLLHRHRGG
jgi:hypothetical protein